MSREAQAAREKQARIILGEAELEIAHSFQEAAESYHDNPTALHLRAMNMLYEGLKEKGALMLMPSSAVESMGMGGMLGAAAMRQATLAAATRLPGSHAAITRTRRQKEHLQLTEEVHHDDPIARPSRDAREADADDPRRCLCLVGWYRSGLSGSGRKPQRRWP